MLKQLVRFRLGSYGVEVFNGGMWIPANGKVLENIDRILRSICIR